MQRFMRLAVVSCVLVGCAESSGADPDAWEPSVQRDACGFAEAAVANLDISQRRDRFHATAFARIEAEVRLAPAIIRHEEVMRAGGCRHLQPVPGGTCDPPCAANEFCGTDNACEPAPGGVAAGPLTIKGLSEPIEIEAESFAPGSYVGPTDLPASLFSATDVIGARFEGDTFPTVTLGVTGVAAIDQELVTAGLDLPAGQDGEVTWSPGADPDACIRVVINGPNIVHGAPLDDIIECEGADTGSLQIPQTLLDSFPAGDTPELTEGFDWPLSELTRYSRSRVQTESGAAAMVVRSTAYFPIRHPG